MDLFLKMDMHYYLTNLTSLIEFILQLYLMAKLDLGSFSVHKTFPPNSKEKFSF